MNASRLSGSLSEDLASLDDAAITQIFSDWTLWAREDQLPPAGATDAPWRVWLVLGGRGAGKTRAGAQWVRAKALGIECAEGAPATRIALVGETLADVRRVMVEGVSGLLSVHGDGERPEFEPSKLQVIWPNGSIAQIFSAEDPDSLRGPQFEAAWCDELTEGRLGAVAVLTRGADPALGHVGFLIGETSDALILLGGNQSDKVSVAPFAKSRLLGYRWPKDDAAATPDATTSLDGFARALAHTLEMEGGYTEDAYDPGGPTNFGITLSEFASWTGVVLGASNVGDLKSALKRIAPETVREIYLTRYWTAALCPELPPALALMHFDTAVNQGVGTAIRILQEAVGAGIDGEIGPETRAAIAAMPTKDALSRYADIRRRRYRALSLFWRFGRGWLRRVDSTLAAAAAVLTTLPANVTKGVDEMTETAETPAPAKWWGESITVWGTIITALATVLPAIGPILGIDITAELIREAGDGVVAVVQAIAGLTGTLMAIYGRTRATQPLERRLVKVKL